MRISDWSSDVCSSDLFFRLPRRSGRPIVCERVRASGEVAMAGMLQILTYMFGFYFVIKGLEFFMIAAASPRQSRAGLFIFAGLCLAAFVAAALRSEEHTSELQSLMRISYAVFCLQQKNKRTIRDHIKSQ